MNHIRHFFLKLAFTASMLLWASIAVTPAAAAPIQYSFAGDVTFVHTQLQSRFSTSQLMSGWMKVDSLPDTNSDPMFGNYTITDFSLTIGSPPPWVMGTSGQVEIRNGPPGRDWFNATVNAPDGENVNFLAPRIFDIQLRGPNSIFSSDGLPTTLPPSIAALSNRNQWRLIFGPGNGRRVEGTITSLTAVPLPAAVILFGVGLIALVGLGAGSWRHRKSSLRRQNDTVFMTQSVP